jgi:hypothetical protein
MIFNKQNFLDIAIGFARANSISDVPCSLVLAFGWTTFKTLIFFDGHALDDEDAILGGGDVPQDGACTALDGAARPMLVFTFFAADFFNTSTFHLSLVA